MKTQTADTLAGALPREQERVRELLAIYNTIPSGMFAATLMRRALTRAERAAAGDIAAMIVSCKELMEFTD